MFIESFAPCYSQFLLPADFKETHILFFGFKSPYKKIRETRKLKSIYDLRFAEQKNEGRKNKRWSLRRLEFMPKTSTKNVTQEFHLYIFSLYVKAEYLEKYVCL